MPQSAVRAVETVVFCVSICLVGAGCKRDNHDYGHIEIKSDFRVRGTDAFLYNNTLISADQTGGLNYVATEPVGTGDIVLLRNGQKFRLCSVSVKRDRIVTVSLSGTQGLIHCDVAQ